MRTNTSSVLSGAAPTYRAHISPCEDIITMHRLCRRPDGGPKVVRWLNRRTGDWFGLIDRTGAVLVGEPSSLEPADASLIEHGLAAMSERHLHAFSLSAGPARSILFFNVAAPEVRRSPVLTVVEANPVSRSLAADAATLIGTWWRTEEARRAARRLDTIESRNREAVLHLLMSRHVSTAQQLASVLSLPLPDPARVHVIECDIQLRDQVIRACKEWAPPSTFFVVPCPTDRRHVIVLTPADSGPPTTQTRMLEEKVAGTFTGCAIGTSDIVALPDTATGYEQAFDALAVARRLPDGCAKFHQGLDPVVLFEPAAADWATQLLAPLLDYAPTRGSDPGTRDLIATLQSWLSFSTAATQRLTIHRNTLRTRLQHIESLLGLDLGRVDHQAALALALRIRRRPLPPKPSEPSGPMPTPTFADLMRAPAMYQWAHIMLHPVLESTSSAALESSLRAWLANNARLSTTAVALGLSVPGARKRIRRIEQLLERPLLHAPEARHELYMAIRAIDASATARSLSDSQPPCGPDSGSVT